MSHHGSKRQQDRLAMGAAAVLSLSHAADLLPLADDEARSWLRNQGLVRDLAGRDVVVWEEVLAELKDERQRSKWKAARLELPRVTLEPL